MKFDPERKYTVGEIITFVFGVILMLGFIAGITGHRILWINPTTDNSANCANVAGSLNC